MAYVGSERLLSPLIAALISKIEKERYFDLLKSILSYDALPEVVVRKATSLLLRTVLVAAEDSSAEEPANARKALSALQLRHARIVEDVCAAAMKNEDEKEAVEQIVLSLSMVCLVHSYVS